MEILAGGFCTQFAHKSLGCVVTQASSSSSHDTVDELYVSRRGKWGQVDLMSYVHIVLLPKIGSVFVSGP